MTGRAVPEWVGATPDTDIPPRVRLRVWERDLGQCQECTRKIIGKDWVCDHATALINGGENRERNLRVICGWCDRKVKTPADVAEKSKVARVKGKRLGTQRRGAPIPGSKRSGWRKRLDGTVERRSHQEGRGR